MHLHNVHAPKNLHSYALYKISCEHKLKGIQGNQVDTLPRINRSSEIKFCVKCGAVDYVLVPVTNYYYGVLLQKDVVDIVE